MYICVCKAITEKQIDQIIKENKKQDAKNILLQLGVGKYCGCCKDYISDLLTK